MSVLLTSPMSVLLTLTLSMAVAAGETPCQICCSPGGDCSKASHGNPGVCCGVKNGLGMCCPAIGAKCWTCSNEYRCYTGSRPPPNICGAGSGSRSEGGANGDVAAFTSSLVGIICMVLIAFSIYQCMRSRSIPLAQQQGIAMAPVQPCGIPMAKPGQPIGQPCAGMPVASAYPASQCYPQGYPAHGYPQAYPCQAGYGGGTVAMGAGMGFLGGMMVGDMMADAGHHGGGYGGDYGGGGGGDMGGDFAADM